MLDVVYWVICRLNDIFCFCLNFSCSVFKTMSKLIYMYIYVMLRNYAISACHVYCVIVYILEEQNVRISSYCYVLKLNSVH